MANHDLDCRGMSCPMPIVRISRTMQGLAVEDTLTVQAKDPSFRADVEAWVRKLGQELHTFSEQDGIQTAVIIKRV
jgi:tRNA 2-thiouridine synthesizing protein A